MQVFDVFKPTGTFSRRTQQPPILAVYWRDSSQAAVPCREDLACLSRMVAPVPVAIASVHGGHVTLFYLPLADVRPPADKAPCLDTMS